MLEVKGKKVLVLGLGRSGLAAAKLLLRKGAEVYLSESSSEEAIEKNIKKIRSDIAGLETSGHSKDFCSVADLVVTSPGVDSFKLSDEGILNPEQVVIGELELAWQFSPAYTIAVTGTNGKSTTSTLLRDILVFEGKDAHLCGNIGVPLSEILEKLDQRSVTVIEVSSFQLQTIKSFSPDVAILLNVASDHFQRHGGIKGYVDTKFDIFRNQDPEQWAIIHDSLRKEAENRNLRAQCVFYGDGMSGKKYERGSFTITSPLDDFLELTLPREDIPNRSGHYLANIEAASLAALITGAGFRSISDAVKSFQPLPHRFQRVARIDGIDFIDDSKATNIDSAVKAVEAVEGKVVLIAGGTDKGIDYREAVGAISGKVKVVVAMGEARERIRKAFVSEVPVIFAAEMNEAVEKAFALAERDETVLLAPMCSSFDMYENYQQRGRLFTEAVKSISSRAGSFFQL